MVITYTLIAIYILALIYIGLKDHKTEDKGRRTARKGAGGKSGKGKNYFETGFGSCLRN